jgi:hypothetical protein
MTTERERAFNKASSIVGGAQREVYIYDRTAPEEGIIPCEVIRSRSSGSKPQIKMIWFAKKEDLINSREDGCRMDLFYLDSEMCDLWSESVFFELADAEAAHREYLLQKAADSCDEVRILDRKIKELEAQRNVVLDQAVQKLEAKAKAKAKDFKAEFDADRPSWNDA